MLFTAANLLPPQVVITPLYRLYLALPLPHLLSDNGLFYDQYFGIMVIHVAFQLGLLRVRAEQLHEDHPERADRGGRRRRRAHVARSTGR